MNDLKTWKTHKKINGVMTTVRVQASSRSEAQRLLQAQYGDGQYLWGVEKEREPQQPKNHNLINSSDNKSGGSSLGAIILVLVLLAAAWFGGTLDNAPKSTTPNASAISNDEQSPPITSPQDPAPQIETPRRSSHKKRGANLNNNYSQRELELAKEKIIREKEEERIKSLAEFLAGQ